MLRGVSQRTVFLLQACWFHWQQRKTSDPIWGWPEMDAATLKMDWLHVVVLVFPIPIFVYVGLCNKSRVLGHLFLYFCRRFSLPEVVDLGVAAYFLGSVLNLIVAPPGLSMYGGTVATRLAAIWALIRQYYKEGKHSSDVLKALPESRFRKTPPFLKAQGATIRKLIPFFSELTSTWNLEEHGDEAVAAKAAMQCLSKCYSCLSHAPDAPGPDVLKHEAIKFKAQVVALHNSKPNAYALPPKMHWFEELASEGHNPSDTWNYRDEDFGGSLARMSHREGGVQSVLSVSRTCLSRFMMRTHAPDLSKVGAASAASSSAGPQ